MRQIHADNTRNESQIDFVSDDHHLHQSPDEFFAAAIRLLHDGYDSAENIEKYITNATWVARTITELRTAVEECLAITPIPDFFPNLKGAVAIHSFRDDWNLQEFVWRCGDQYWYMNWGTAA